MCFNPKVSSTFAIIGAIATYVAYKNPVLRKQHTYILFAFYTVMEAFQTIQYAYVNQCGTRANMLQTEFAYFLVIVQPLLWNTIFYLRMSSPGNRRVFLVAICMCAVWICMHVASRIPLLIQRYGLSTDTSSTGETCTRRRTDESHLYWQWSMADFHGLNANWLFYLCVWFIPCLLVSETRSMGIVLLVGASIGAAITVSQGRHGYEFAATWCYISIPMMLLVFVDLYLGRKHA